MIRSLNSSIKNRRCNCDSAARSLGGVVFPGRARRSRRSLARGQENRKRTRKYTISNGAPSKAEFVLFFSNVTKRGRTPHRLRFMLLLLLLIMSTSLLSFFSGNNLLFEEQTEQKRLLCAETQSNRRSISYHFRISMLYRPKVLRLDSRTTSTHGRRAIASFAKVISGHGYLVGMAFVIPSKEPVHGMSIIDFLWFLLTCHRSCVYCTVTISYIIPHAHRVELYNGVSFDGC